MKTVIVTSANPVKIGAVSEGFRRMFPDEEFQFESITVSSGVADQPMGDRVILQGARTRAENARMTKAEADFWVGIEGGADDVEGEVVTFAWVYILAADGRHGKAKTVTFVLPPAVAELVRQGKELGEADDIVFGRTNSKQANGAIGLLTHDVLTRTTEYTSGVIMALVPFKNNELYRSSAPS